MVAALVVLASVVVLGVRTASVCDADVGCLLVAGERFTNEQAVTIPVEPGDGYDAQFYYRQVRSPFDLSMSESNGVTFDTEVRYGRVGYPIAAWVLSAGGQPALVPWAMLAVSVLSLGAIAWVLASAARQAGRSPWWGAVATAVPGLWFAAGRALADPFSAALVGAAALALGRRSWRWAAALFAIGVVTKEQAVLVPFAYGVWRIWTLVRERATERIDPRGADLPWLAPAVVFVVWQGALFVATGSVPALEAGGAHVVLPMSDLMPAMWDWITPDGATQLLWLIEVLVIVWLAAVVALARTSNGWERLVAVGTVALVAALNDNVFVDPAHFRQLAELSVVLLIVAFRAEPRWWVPAIGANAVATVGVLGRLSSDL